MVREKKQSNTRTGTLEYEDYFVRGNDEEPPGRPLYNKNRKVFSE